jgi:hypothetical protein
MPRYFFAVESPVLWTVDKEGEILADERAAHSAAQQTARELRGIYDNAVVVVRDEDGRIVTEVPIDQDLN